MRERRRSPAVSCMRKCRPCQLDIDRDGVAGDAGLGPGQQPLLAEQAVDQRRLAGVGTPDHRDLDRSCRVLHVRATGLVVVRFAGRGGLGQRRAQRLVEIGQALAVLGRDRHRLAEPERIGFVHARLRRPALALVGDQDRGLAGLRTRSAKARSTGVGPARASIRKSMASAAAIAASVCACMRPVRLAGAASSSPAVSIAVKVRSPSRARPSRRSRVTPGRSSTSARRLPTRRLNSVDLPTFGRPTMATVKLMLPRALWTPLYARRDG